MKFKRLAQSPASPGWVLIDIRWHSSGWFYIQVGRYILRAGR